MKACRAACTGSLGRAVGRSGSGDCSHPWARDRWSQRTPTGRRRVVSRSRSSSWRRADPTPAWPTALVPRCRACWRPRENPPGAPSDVTRDARHRARRRAGRRGDRPVLLRPGHRGPDRRPVAGRDRDGHRRVPAEAARRRADRLVRARDHGGDGRCRAGPSHADEYGAVRRVGGSDPGRGAGRQEPASSHTPNPNPSTCTWSPSARTPCPSRARAPPRRGPTSADTGSRVGLIATRCEPPRR